MSVSSISHSNDRSGKPLPSRSGPPQRILVVDDEPLICRLNADILEDAGHLVDVAEDGAAAWAALQLKEYDVMVTDNQMPKSSGIELVTKIRTAGMVLPILMATGTLPEEEFTDHLWLQPFALLLKPYSLAELLGAVESLLPAPNNGCAPTVLVPNWECRPSVFGLRL
jgi:DNA-binding response OmpR family regulator